MEGWNEKNSKYTVANLKNHFANMKEEYYLLMKISLPSFKEGGDQTIGAPTSFLII